MKLTWCWVHALLQSKFLTWTGLDKHPISFHVKDHSTWLAYEITSPEKVQEQLPPNLQLSPISVFNETERYALFYNFFEVHSPFFQGHRLEFVTVGQDRDKGTKHFVILDYLSDTISSDPTMIFRKASRSQMNIFRNMTSPVHACEIPKEFYLLCAHSIRSSSNLFVRPEFGIDCNKEIYYGSSRVHQPNKLSFNSSDTQQVRTFIPLVVENPFHIDIRNAFPYLAFYYPHDIPFQISMI